MMAYFRILHIVVKLKINVACVIVLTTVYSLFPLSTWKTDSHFHIQQRNVGIRLLSSTIQYSYFLPLDSLASLMCVFREFCVFSLMLLLLSAQRLNQIQLQALK